MEDQDKVIYLPWEQEESIPVLINRTSAAIRRDIEYVLRPYGVTSQQSKTLHVLKASPGLTNMELERLLHIDKSSVTSLINGMVKRGWVERREHPQDARMKTISLTAAGEEMQQITHVKVHEAKHHSKQLLTPEEQGQLLVLLRKILDAYE
ncbi:MarR family winged helix-turn-helix transcriptional regulator [Paenibacillus donghaensis]|uniref:HTH marR-type domain-containing protein n=1 Tax=Paenibacillus donghaensis TaxID=414771 RepID=A0A2Z2KT82_9BACL|nr:MarR family transcriptional regulator [Paenibacillus donghaensis]ASA22558.1 hypothetical protein B9T62_18275 [Paenibacillus donghaensis]